MKNAASRNNQALRAYCPNVYTVPISAVDPNKNEKYIANIVNTKNMTINVVSGMPNALPMGMRFIPLSVTVCNDLQKFQV